MARKMVTNLKLVQGQASVEESAANWLARLDSADVSLEELEGFASWLEEHPSHEVIYRELKDNWSRLSTLAALSDTEKMALQKRLLVNTPATERPGMWGGIKTQIAAIAAVLVVSVIGYRAFDQSFLPENTYQTEVGARQTVFLSDGSSVTLNTDSRITVYYSSEERQILLVSGEAFFDVAHDSARPFIVRVGDKQVRAVGTAFNIFRQTKEFSVLVTDGTVSVSTVQPNISQGMSDGLEVDGIERLLVSKGEKVKVLDTVEAAIKIPAPSTDKDLSWQSGVLEFEDETLADVVQQFDRYTDKKIIFLDDDLRSMKVGGVFEAGNVEALVSALEIMLPIEVTRMTPYYTLLDIKDD